MKPGFLRLWTSAIEGQESLRDRGKKMRWALRSLLLRDWESFQAMEECPATSIGKGDPGRTQQTSQQTELRQS